LRRRRAPGHRAHDQAAWLQRVAYFADPAGRVIEPWSPLTPKP